MSQQATLAMLLKVRSDLKGLEQGQKEMKKTTKVAKTLNTTVKKSLRVGAGFLGVSVGVASLNRQLTRTIDLASKISDEGFQLQIDPRIFQGINALGLDAGVKTEIISRGIRHITVRTEEATQGAKNYQKAFRQLNIDLETFSSLDTASKVGRIAQAYDRATDKQKALAAISKIVGEEAGPKMLEIFDRIATEGLGPVTKWALAAGLAFDSWELHTLDQIADQIARLGQKVSVASGRFISHLSNEKSRKYLMVSFKEIAQNFGVDVLETIYDVSTLVPNYMIQGMKGFTSWFGDTLKLVGNNFLISIFEGINSITGKLNKLPGVNIGNIDTSKQLSTMLELIPKVSNPLLNPVDAALGPLKEQFSNEMFSFLRPDESVRIAAAEEMFASIHAMNKEVEARNSNLFPGGDEDESSLSFFERLRTVMAGINEETVSINDRFKSVIKSFESGFGGSISNALDGLMNKTKSLGMTFKDIWNGFLSSMISALTRGVGEWAASESSKFLISKVFAEKSLAMNAINAAKSLAIWKPSAIAASISSMGSAALIGAAAVASVLALSDGFYNGRYTGDGDPHDIAGVVHKKEFVFDNVATSNAGVGALNTAMDDLKKGRPAVISPRGVTSGIASAAGGGQREPLYLAMYDSRRDGLSGLKGKAGEKIIIDIAQRYFHEISRHA